MKKNIEKNDVLFPNISNKIKVLIIIAAVLAVLLGTIFFHRKSDSNTAYRNVRDFYQLAVSTLCQKN